MVIKDDRNDLLQSAKAIFETLSDDPSYQATDNSTRDEVVMGEAVRRANQSHRNNLALSLGSDLNKFMDFMKADAIDEELRNMIIGHSLYDHIINSATSQASRVWASKQMAMAFGKPLADVQRELIALGKGLEFDIEEEDEEDIFENASEEEIEAYKQSNEELTRVMEDRKSMGDEDFVQAQMDIDEVGLGYVQTPFTPEEIARLTKKREPIPNANPRGDAEIVFVANGLQSKINMMLDQKHRVEMLKRRLKDEEVENEDMATLQKRLEHEEQRLFKLQIEVEHYKGDMHRVYNEKYKSPRYLIEHGNVVPDTDSPIAGNWRKEGEEEEIPENTEEEEIPFEDYGLAIGPNETLEDVLNNPDYSDAVKEAYVKSGNWQSGINFKVMTGTGYSERTAENSKADMTVAFGVDFNTRGELLTKNLVESRGKWYLQVDMAKDFSDRELSDFAFRFRDRRVQSINVAGNGIYTANMGTQKDVDDYVFRFLEKLIAQSTTQQKKGLSIQSGGQSGADEAGAKAGLRLGLPTTVISTSDWKFRGSDGKDIKDKEAFKRRFSNTEQDPEGTTVDTGHVPSNPTISEPEAGRTNWQEADVAIREISSFQIDGSQVIGYNTAKYLYNQGITTLGDAMPAILQLNDMRTNKNRIWPFDEGTLKNLLDGVNPTQGEAESTPSTAAAPQDNRTAVEQLTEEVNKPTERFGAEDLDAPGYGGPKQRAAGPNINQQNAMNRSSEILGDLAANAEAGAMKPIPGYRPTRDEQNPLKSLQWFLTPYADMASLIKKLPYDISGSIKPHLQFLDVLNKANDEGEWEGDKYPTKEISSLAIRLVQMIALENTMAASDVKINWNKVDSSQVFSHPDVQKVIRNLLPSDKAVKENYSRVQDSRLKMSQELNDLLSSLSMPEDQIGAVAKNGDVKMKTWRDIGNRFFGNAEQLYGKDAPLMGVPGNLNSGEKMKVLVSQYVQEFGPDLSPPKNSEQFYRLAEIKRASDNWYKYFSEGGRPLKFSRNMPDIIIKMLDGAPNEVARNILSRFHADPELYLNPARQGIHGQEGEAREWLQDQIPDLKQKYPGWFSKVGTGGLIRSGHIVGCNQDDIMALIFLIAPEVDKYQFKKNNPRNTHNDIDKMDLDESHQTILDGLTEKIEKIKSLESPHGGIGDIFLYGDTADDLNSNQPLKGNIKLGVRIFAQMQTGQHDLFDPNGFSKEQDKEKAHQNIREMMAYFQKEIESLFADVTVTPGQKVVTPNVYFSNDASKMGMNQQPQPGEKRTFIHFPGDYVYNQINQVGDARKDKSTGETQAPFDPFMNGPVAQAKLRNLLPSSLFDAEGDLTEDTLKAFQNGENLSFKLAGYDMSVPELMHFIRESDAHKNNWGTKWENLHNLESEDAFDSDGNPRSLYAHMQRAIEDHGENCEIANAINHFTEQDADLYRLHPQSSDITDFMEDSKRIKDKDKTLAFLGERTRLQNSISNKEFLLAELKFKRDKETGEILEGIPQNDPEMGRLREERDDAYNQLNALMTHPDNFDRQGNAINGLAVVQQANANVDASQAKVLSTTEDYRYGRPTNALELDNDGQPIPERAEVVLESGERFEGSMVAVEDPETGQTVLEDRRGEPLFEPLLDVNDNPIINAETGQPIPDVDKPIYRKKKTKRTVMQTSQGHKGQALQEPIEILVDEREGGVEEFYRTEHDDVINKIWGYDITDDADENSVHIPGLYLELQNRDYVRGEDGSIRHDRHGFPRTKSLAKGPQGFKNLIVNLVWTNPENKSEQVIIGHMAPRNLGDILTETAARAQKIDNPESINNLYTPDELKNMDFVFLPATVDSQTEGVRLIPTRRPTRRMEEVILPTEDEEAQMGVSEEVKQQLNTLLSFGAINNIDLDGNPTPEAIAAAKEVLAIHGYDPELAGALGELDLFQEARLAKAENESHLLNQFVLDDEIEIDRNANGDIVALMEDGEDVTLMDHESVDDLWSVSDVFTQLLDQKQKAHQNILEALWDNNPDDGYTQSLARSNRYRNNISPKMERVRLLEPNAEGELYEMRPSLDGGQIGFYFGGSQGDEHLDLQEFYTKLQSGLSEKGIFSLEDEDSAANLLESILGHIGHTYGDGAVLQPYMENLSSVKLVKNMNSLKKQINELTPEARQWFLSTFMSRAYKTEQAYITSLGKTMQRLTGVNMLPASGVPLTKADRDLKKQLRDLHGMTHSASEYGGGSSKLSQQARARIFFNDHLKDAQEISATGVFPTEDIEYRPIGWEARQKAAESVALRHFRDRRAKDKGLESSAREWKPIEVMNVLQWIQDYFSKSPEQQEEHLNNLEAMPFQYNLNPATGDFYIPGEDPEADAKLYHPATLRDLINTIKEEVLSDEVSEGLLYDSLNGFIKELNQRGWNSRSPVRQENIDFGTVMQDLAMDPDAEAAGWDQGLLILKRLNDTEYTPLSQVEGTASDSIENILPAMYWSNRGKGDAWQEQIKKDWAKYEKVAEILGYKNTKELLEAENILHYDQTGSKLTQGDFGILDQKLQRWAKGKKKSPSSASQTQHLSYNDDDGTFTLIADKNGSRSEQGPAAQLNKLATAVQEDPKLGADVWSTLVMEIGLESGIIAPDKLISLTRSLIGLGKEHSQLVSQYSPLTLSLTLLKKLDMREWNDKLQSISGQAKTALDITPTEQQGGYGYVGRSPSQYLSDMTDELLQIASLSGVPEDMGEDRVLYDREIFQRGDGKWMWGEKGPFDFERQAVEASETEPLYRGVHAENAMLAYLQGALIDIMAQAPDMLQIAKEANPKLYKNVDAATLGFNSMYVLMNELFQAYYPKIKGLVGNIRDWEGVDMNLHISEQQPKDLIFNDRPDERDMIVTNRAGKREIVSKVGATHDFAKLGFFRNFARPDKDDRESSLWMRHDWARIIPRMEYRHHGKKQVSYVQSDMADGFGKVIMDSADQIVQYAFYNHDTDKWELYAPEMVEFKNDGTPILDGPPKISISGAVLEQHFVKGETYIESADGSASTIDKSDPNNILENEVETQLNTTGTPAFDRNGLDAYFGNKLSNKWKDHIMRMVMKGDHPNLEQLNEYFKGADPRWEEREALKHPYVYRRMPDQQNKPSTVQPFEQWWADFKENSDGIDPATGKVYPWKQNEDYQVLQGVRNTIQREFPFLYESIFDDNGRIAIDQDEGHPGLEALHDFLLANGLQGIDVDENLNKHDIKKLLATMLQATQQILLGTPEQAVGLGEDVIENFREFAAGNGWDLAGTAIAAEVEEIATGEPTATVEETEIPLEVQEILDRANQEDEQAAADGGDDLTARLLAHGVNAEEIADWNDDMKQDILNILEGSSPPVDTDVSPVDTGDWDPERFVKVSKNTALSLINELLPQELRQQALEALGYEFVDGIQIGEPSGGYIDEFFIRLDGKVNPNFLGIANMDIDPEIKAGLLNQMHGFYDYLRENDLFDYNLRTNEQLGDRMTVKAKNHPLDGEDILNIGSTGERDLLTDFLALNSEEQMAHASNPWDIVDGELIAGEAEPVVEPSSEVGTSDAHQQIIDAAIAASNNDKLVQAAADKKTADTEAAQADDKAGEVDEKIRHIMSLRYPGFDWTEETPEGTKRKERDPNDPAWHMLEHYEALKQNNPEEFGKEYVKWYIDKLHAGEGTQSLSADERNDAKNTIIEAVKKINSIQSPTSDPIEVTQAYLNALSDKDLKNEVVTHENNLRDMRIGQRNGRLKHEANNIQKFADMFEKVMQSPNKVNVTQMAMELRMHRLKFDADEPIEMDPKKTGTTHEPWLIPAARKALYEGPESIYGQLKALPNPATGQPFLNEAELDEVEAQIRASLETTEEGIDGQALLDTLQTQLDNFDAQVTADVQTEEGFNKWMQDNGFNNMFREDVHANKFWFSTGGYAVIGRGGETADMQRGEEKPLRNSMYRLDAPDADVEDQIDWKRPVGDDPPMVWNPFDEKMEQAVYWNGMWVNHRVIKKVMQQAAVNNADVFLRNPAILNLAREKYTIPDGVADEALQVIIPAGTNKPAQVLISQHGHLFALPSNDKPVTEGQLTADQLVAHAISRALGLTLSDPNIEVGPDGEPAPAILVSTVDENGVISHIPWDTFQGDALGVLPDKEVPEPTTAPTGDGVAASYLAQLRGQPEEVQRQTNALQQLYETNMIPGLQGIVDFVDEVKGQKHTHKYQQAYNMAIVQEHEKAKQLKDFRRAVGIKTPTEEELKQQQAQEEQQALERKHRQTLVGNEYTRLRGEGVSEAEAYSQATSNVNESLSMPQTPSYQEVPTGVETPFEMRPEGFGAGETNVPEAEETSNIFDQDIDPESIPDFLNQQKGAVKSLTEFLSS